MIAAAFTYLMFMTGVMAWSVVAVIAALMIARALRTWRPV